MIQDSFGFEKVPPEERTHRVKEVFTRVANKYDLMNDLMSLGIHRFWKQDFINRLPLKPNVQLLDVAGGTGDIALDIMQRFCYLNPQITLCDLTPSMMHVGKERAYDKGITHGLQWVCGNGENLPFPDNSFDIYTISFGLRNITHLEKALTEAYRVLKPGGHFFCLEFSKVQSPLLKKFYDSYSFHVLPWLGQVVSNDRPSYQYLVESIGRFPNQENLALLLKKVDFISVHWHNFIMGVASIHQAQKGKK